MQLADILEHLRTSKDPKNNKAFEILDAIFKSPYFDSYIALKAQMERWNKEIVEKGITLKSTDENDKSFDRAHKYFTEMTFYIKSLEELKQKMLPEELKQADNFKSRSTEQILDQVVSAKRS